MVVTKSSLPRPVVKWAGGKKQLIGELAERCPQDFANYLEPFVGGGILYLSLWRLGRIHGTAVLNDANPELINLYKMIRDRPEELVEQAAGPEFVNTKEAYLSCRNRFNEIRGTDACLERAVLFLYLNHHGYNGLWRVNRKGEYNIPFGQYVRPPRFCNANAIFSMSDALTSAVLMEGDFGQVMPKIQKGDFVYLDPPYHPLSSTAYFTSYTTGPFLFEEQERLFGMFREADRAGASVMLSNSVAPEILEMYGEYFIERVPVLRLINVNGARRAGGEEIIVRNYEGK
ncbi:Dam family site-specific DNA-(adenine-N6)-methyltransferase [Methanorbis rubei]|uniref:site-specific DNA-methyltransferase (adenine-specific) n=1 Tax=Methanorbis rubei TaxID=3028300 RepID=A0AAE4MIG6_9EURY|nr:Modification methylase DpnIIA [Methanocorpusculaceae archaeon Cs1]